MTQKKKKKPVKSLIDLQIKNDLIIVLYRKRKYVFKFGKDLLKQSPKVIFSTCKKVIQIFHDYIEKKHPAKRKTYIRSSYIISKKEDKITAVLPGENQTTNEEIIGDFPKYKSKEEE
jgi:hypothetical protein